MVGNGTPAGSDQSLRPGDFNSMRFGFERTMPFIESLDDQPDRESHVGWSQRHGQPRFRGISPKAAQCDPYDLTRAPKQSEGGTSRKR